MPTNLKIKGKTQRIIQRKMRELWMQETKMKKSWQRAPSIITTLGQRNAQSILPWKKLNTP